MNNSATCERAKQVIAAGGVIAFLTDTFYGLGADPLNSTAVEKIRILKGRDDTKPILVLISDLDQLERFVPQPTETFKKLAAKLWPGPITLIGTASSELPNALTSGSATVGVRLPASKRVRELIRACGGALTATSANPSGSLPALTAAEVESYFPNGLDLVVDGGEVFGVEPSTVVDVSGGSLKIVRAGAIDAKRIKSALET